MKIASICLVTSMVSLLVSHEALARRATPPNNLGRTLSNLGAIEHRVMAAVDVASLIEEDQRPHEKPTPFRVAYATSLSLTTHDAGTWEELPDGGRVWRLRISSPGAIFLSFKFSEFALPEGAELHFVSVDRDYFDGPYTHKHNRPQRRFGSPMVPGDSAMIELFLPAGAESAALEIESISHGYRNVMGMGSFAPRPGSSAATDGSFGRPEPAALAGGAFDCQRDINCPEGAPYQDVKRAAAEGYDGQYICSGQLVNNVRQDNRYLYLTAAHCEWWIDPPTMTYYWNYENSGCGTNDAPLTFSTGSTDLYHDVVSDIDLLELDGTDLESTFDIYFMGWNRSTGAPSSAATVGFPNDKPLQISIENDPVTDCAPGGCPSGWGADFWRVEAYDVGVTEGGSSGGALMDEDNLLVGVLTGGVGTNCNNFDWDEYAKLHPEWPNLQPFLDPDATGASSLAGKDHDENPVAPVPSASVLGSALLAGLLIGLGGWTIRRTSEQGARL